VVTNRDPEHAGTKKVEWFHSSWVSGAHPTLGKEHAMKLNSAQIENTLDQFEAEVLPEDNPVVQKLTELFGDHTYFLDQAGLNIVEIADQDSQDGRTAVVVNIANWTDEGSSKLAPHKPERTDVLLSL
jgi:uncharacterized Fe-S cluster-containing radical SAM superfamily protein